MPVQDEYALQSLFTHLYGELGTTVARLADLSANERVAVLDGGDEQLRFVSQPSSGQQGDDEPEDPLPSVEFVQATDLTAMRAAQVVVGLPPVGPGPALRRPVGLVEDLAHDRLPTRAVLLLPASLLAHTKPDLRAALLAAGSVEDVVIAQARSARGAPATINWAVVRVSFAGRKSRAKTKVSSLSGEYSEGFMRELDPETPWTLTYLDPDVEDRIDRWARRTNARPLMEMLADDVRDRESHDTSPPLRARAVKRSGLDLEEVDHDAEEKRRPTQVLRSGDVLGRTIGDDPMWCVVPDEADGRRVVAGQLHVLAPVGITPQLLVAFLNSDMSRLQLQRGASRLGAIPRVSAKELRELRVPDLPGLEGLDPTGAVHELRAASSDLLEVLTGQVGGAFDLGQDDLRNALVGAERDARLAAVMIRQVRDDGYRAQQTFPHPLARVIRQLRMRQDAQDARGSYDELIRLGETATIFLGVVMGSLLQQEGLECAELEQWRTSVSQGGVSLGHWQGLVRRGAEAARRSGRQLGGLASALRTNGPLEGAMESLLKQRNDDAHGAAPRTPFEHQSRLDELSPRLNDMLAELSALAHSQFFIVDKMEYASTRGFRLEGRDLRGDHPDFMPWARMSEQPLDTGIVHIDFGDGGRPLALHNYCRLIACTQCLREELYYPDRVKGDEIQMRSLERGHRTSAVDAVAAGLLLGQ